MLATLLAVSMLQAATPQRAAVQIVSIAPKAPATVRRTNIVGRYAAVLTGGGVMEGSYVTAPILVEHFSFGWQPIDLLNFRCRLDSHDFTSRTIALLMRGMPKPQDDRPCRGVLTDSGPWRDIEAVRRLMREPLVPAVIVSGNWAMGEWYGAGGGEALFRRRDGRWTRITGGGGAMGVEEMREYSVPRADWCKFGIYDAKCH